MRPFVASAVLLAIGVASCGPDGGEPPPRPCTSFDAACAPAYEPVFDQVFARTLQPTCAISANCHGSAGKQGRITFVAVDQAYDALMQRGLVTAGDATCSTVSVRIRSTDPFTRMPPGRALPEDEACAIQQWIARGAKR